MQLAYQQRLESAAFEAQAPPTRTPEIQSSLANDNGLETEFKDIEQPTFEAELEAFNQGVQPELKLRPAFEQTVQPSRAFTEDLSAHNAGASLPVVEPTPDGLPAQFEQATGVSFADELAAHNEGAVTPTEVSADAPAPAQSQDISRGID